MSDFITGNNYKKLILQVNASGLSFCCIHTNQVITYKSVAFFKSKPVEDELWKAFVNNTELTRQYDEVVVLHNNSFNTFVPAALFDENNPGAYLQYNTKVFESDFFAFDFIENYNIYNVYIPLVNVNNFLIDQFGAFEYKNTNSILTEKLLDISKPDNGYEVFVHVQDFNFEIIVANNKKLQLFNSFEYTTPQDFLYYLLFTLEQLKLEPDSCIVTLLGKINEQNPSYLLAYTYIRNLEFLDVSNLINTLGIDEKQARENFILLNS